MKSDPRLLCPTASLILFKSTLTDRQPSAEYIIFEIPLQSLFDNFWHSLPEWEKLLSRKPLPKDFRLTKKEQPIPDNFHLLFNIYIPVLDFLRILYEDSHNVTQSSIKFHIFMHAQHIRFQPTHIHT